MKNNVFKNFAKFTGKHTCQSLFLIKLLATLKKDSVADVFLWILQNFSEHLFKEHLGTTASG